MQLLLSQALTASMCMSPQGLEFGGIGVWSPPGSGKTISAVVSSRYRDAKMTLVVCPANVVPMWAGFRCKDEGVFRRGEVQKCYPHILMKAVKNMKDLIDVSRGWVDANGNHGNHGSCDAPRFMVISYGLLQHADAENKMKILAEQCFASGFPVEMIIFDEIHLLKMRCTRIEIANRLKAARVLVCRCREIAEAKMFVQGMSATPVINTLHEATSLIGLITTGTSGLPEFSEAQSYRVENCLAVHRKLMEVGLRHTAQHYAHPKFVFVDGTARIKQVPACERDGLRLEVALTKSRLPAIVKIVKKNKGSGKATILYTHFIGAALDGSSQSNEIYYSRIDQGNPRPKVEYLQAKNQRQSGFKFYTISK